MAYTYKKKTITGQSTTAKVFKKSGIKKAKKKETNLNPDTGCVYKCTKGGDAKTAQWQYVKTIIVKKPQGGVSMSAPVRQTGGSRKIDANWTVPKALTNDAGSRATDLLIDFKLDLSSGTDPVDKHTTSDQTKTSYTVDLDSFGADKPKKTYHRADFYPYAGKPMLKNVSCTVTPKNKKGKGTPDTKTLTFKVPRVPTLAATEIDENGVVSCVITTNAGEDAQERLDTRVQIDVYDSSEAKPEWKTVVDTTTTATSYTASRQVPNWQVAGKFVKVRFRACARGYAGDSVWSDYRTHVVGWPNAATITEDGVTIPGKTSDAIATFPIKTNTDADHATDQVVLQKLVNVTAETPEQATAMSDSWQDTDYKDDAQCTALACSVGDLLPDEGKYTWVRVKSWHDVEGVFFVYSKPYRVKALETAAPTASDDAVAIVGTAQGVNGSSYKVTMGWNADGADDADGTQLTWSDEPDAWESTEKPTEFEFTESDGPVTHGTTTYRDSRTIVIKGLTEGEPTYIRARRYMDDVDGNRTYGPWSDQAAVIPTVAPSAVVLTAPAFVAAGSDVQYRWAFAGGGTQRAWQLVNATDGAVIAEGTDAFGSCTVPAARAASFAVGGKVRAKVRVSTGGDFVESDVAVSTAIVQAPTLSIGAVSTLTAQPLSIPLTCSTSTAKVAVVVTALGATAQTAAGAVQQPAGDTVWSGALRPAWTASGGAWACSLPLPEGRAFVDKGRYRIEATATDEATGLQSAAVPVEFGVAWARTAPLPPQDHVVKTSDASIVAGKVYFTWDATEGEYVEVENPVASQLANYYEEIPGIAVEPAIVTDDDGGTDRICTLTLIPPENVVAGDVYDIYRLTKEGARLIGRGYPTECTVVDSYAPFGDGAQAYRVSLRTADGDEAWADYDYYLEGDVLRLDYAGAESRYVELPYNITVSDSYSKDYEGRLHMDGSKGGGWNAGVERSGKLSTDILRIENPETVAALYDMAQTAGPVFVRTPDGSAYEANVEADMDMDNDQVVAVALDAEECGLTGEFMLPPYTTQS